MATEYINPQWRLPNEKTGNNKGYSMNFQTQTIPMDASINDVLTTGTEPFSWSIWFNVESVSNTYNEFVAYGGGANRNGVRIYGGVFKSNANIDLNSTTTIQTNQWYHGVVTYDGTTRKIYVNGVLEASDTPTLAVQTNSSYPLTIGKYPDGSRYTFGKLKDVSFFNYALSDGGVAIGASASGSIGTLYGSGNPGNPMALASPPKAYYPLGDSAHMGANYLTPNGALQDYVFDFASSTISIGDLSSVEGSDFTISLWLNRDSAHSSVIYNSGSAYPNGLIFQSNQNGSFFISVGGGDGTTSTMTITDGIWYNAILTVSGTTAKVYVNGSQLGSDLTVGSARTGIGSGTVIGEYNHGSGFYFNGKLSNVQVFNSALSGPEATTLYNNGSPIQTLANIPQNSNLKAWYKLDATEIYNSTSTEWSVDNNQNPSAYPSSLDFGTFLDNKYITINNTFDSIITGTNFTISSWINLDSINSQQLKFIFTNESLQFTITNKIATYLRGASGYFLSPFGSNTTLSTGKWYNIVLAKSGNDYTYYLNGSPDGTTNNSTSIVNSSETTSLIGNYSYASNTYGFDGRISNTQIFNTALTDGTGGTVNQIETLYNNGNPLTDMSSFSSLVSWWKLDNTTTGIGDSSANYTTAVNFNYLDTDYLSLGTMSTLSAEAEVTFSIWAKITKPGGTQGFSMIYTDNSDGGTGNKGIIYIEPSGNNARVKCTLRNTSSLRTSLVNHTTFNSWHNITVTFGTTYAKLYLNGQLQDTEAVGTAANLGVNAFLGRYSSTSPVYATGGLLSNFAIFNSELSGPQVLTLFNGGTPETSISFSPVHHWKLNDINTGLNDIGSLASNNATRGAAAPGTVGSGPTTASSLVSSLSGTNNGATEYAGFVNTLAGDSTGMSQTNLVQSDLLTTSSYSPYALNFDGNDYIDCGATVQQPTTNYSVSCWVKLVSTQLCGIVGNFKTGVSPQVGFVVAVSSGLNFAFCADGNASSSAGTVTGTTTPNTSTWYNVIGTYDGSLVKIYVNNVLENSVSYSATPGATDQNLVIGRWYGNYSDYYTNGSISNVSIWNTALTSTQVSEIYNEGRPSNLHNFSGTAPVAWWQLGSNSSWTSPYWTVLDEIGSNDGTSNSMLENAIVDGVGTSGNGVSTNMSFPNNISGSSPNGEGNSLSVNMTLANIAGGVN